MKIVVEFNDFEEMSGFCEEMVKKKIKPAKEKPKPETKEAQRPSETTSPVEETSISTDATSESAPATSEKAKVTLQDVTAKAIPLIDAGRQDELQALLDKYEVPALPSLTEDKLAGFLKDLEGLG